VALFAAVRFWRLTASCLWFDEIFSVHAARHGWTQIFSFVAADLIHPPLFYVLLKVWIGIGGESLLWLRLFPALTSVAAVLPFYLLCREFKLTPHQRNLALLLLAVSGFLIKYAQEVRMYSLLFLLSVTSLYLFLRFLDANVNPRRHIVPLTAVNLLLVYTHYAGWAAVALQIVALLWLKRERLRLFAASLALLLVAYLPWLYELKRAAVAGRGLAQNIGWVARPGLSEIVQSLTAINRPFWFSQSSADVFTDPVSTPLVILLLLFPSIVFGVQLVRAGDYHHWKFARLRTALLFAFAPALFFFAASWILPQSIWGTRHLIISVGPFAILTAVALMLLRPYWIKVSVFLLLACWFLLAGLVSLISPAPQFIWCAWEPLGQEMVRAEPDANRAIRVYAFEDLVAYHLWFGLNATANSRVRVSVIKGTPGLTEDAAYFLPRRFDDIAVTNQPDGDSFWIAFRDRQWNESSPPLNLFINRGYRAGPVLERKAQGVKAFLVRMQRE